ncbi:MAG TPA: hypothetical protein VKF41_10220 [Bryobacteraceae bacterium]|nr:hypothetical protein [Bryobacteraceae bacterium]
MQKLMLAVVLGGLCLHAADIPAGELLPATVLRSANGEHRNQLTLWKASMAALMAANAADAVSSWGKPELNPALSGSAGRFGKEGALLKLGLAGGVVTVEFLVLRRRRSRSLAKALAWINFGDAAVTGAVAGRNFGIPGR